MLSPRWRRVLWGVQPAEPKRDPEPVAVSVAKIERSITAAEWDAIVKQAAWCPPVAPMRYPTVYDETRAHILLPDIEADIAAAEVAFRELVNA